MSAGGGLVRRTPLLLAAGLALWPLAASAAEPLAPGATFRDCAVCPEMVVVPAGSFEMGSADGRDEQRPVHTVTIARPFAIARYEVTFAEWGACVEAGRCESPDDHKWGRDSRPVINVTWGAAAAYADFLSARTGYRYRLPLPVRFTPTPTRARMGANRI